jgi:hypothetical protein
MNGNGNSDLATQDSSGSRRSGSIARSMARSTTTPTTKRGPGKWLPSSLVSHANDDAGAGVLLAAMSHPTNGTASNFRVAKFRDSSGLVAPERIWRENRPGLPPISATIFDLEI